MDEGWNMGETGDGVEDSDEKENDWMNKWKGEEKERKKRKERDWEFLSLTSCWFPVISPYSQLMSHEASFRKWKATYQITSKENGKDL